MKNRINASLWLIILLPALLFFCGQKQEQNREAHKPAVAHVYETKAGQRCFEWNEGRTVAEARLQFKGDSVSGSISFQFTEQDRTQGVFRGVVFADTLKGEYSYQLNGREWIMEMIFKLEGDKLVQGHGPMAPAGRKMVYADPSRVSFSTPFRGVTCK